MLNSMKTETPLYFFHHIPKCGGTSLNAALNEWFDETINDYRAGWTMNYPPTVDLSKLNPNICVTGHFELDGYYLHQRYPEVINSPDYKIFTFIREPLAVKLSLYRYEKLNNVGDRSFEEHLLTRDNYLADRFPATEENYQEVLDRYFFIGILEEYQLSLDILADLIGKPKIPMPWQNKTKGENQEESLSEDLLTKFRERNNLDYLIYDYCCEKFKPHKASYQ